MAAAAAVIEGASTILVFSTTSATWVSKAYGIKPHGEERKALETTLLTDTSHTYIPSVVTEPGQIEVKARFDKANIPTFSDIETVTICLPANGTAATYTATSNRPSIASSAFVTKRDIDDIAIEKLVEVTAVLKRSGAVTYATGN